MPPFFPIALGNTTKPFDYAQGDESTPFGRLRMTLEKNIFRFISDPMASLLASILLTTVLFYSLAKLASLCHSEPASGRAFVTLSVVEGLCVIP